MEEVWKETKYKGYFISNLGRLKGRRGKVIKYQIGETGYYNVAIYPDGSKGKCKCLKIHRLVAEAFIPNDDSSKPIINHIDGNKLNNRVDNLEWCNHSYNIKHAYDMGLRSPKRGYVHTNSKLTEEDVKWIREHYIPRDKQFGSKALAKKFNMNRCNIYRLISKKRYKD
jgi:hypothetical protein